jgi:hypothetical protein
MEKAEAQACHERESEEIIMSWPKVVPPSLKDKIINLFREQTSSEAFATFTCASCGESVSLHGHCRLSLADFDSHVL